MEKFEIKYYLHKPYIQEMSQMSKQELEHEYGNIYGQFTFNIGNYEYIVFIEEGVIPDEILTTELINVHLEQLVKVVNTLEIASAEYIYNIENDFTWIKFDRNEDTVSISELYRNHDWLKGGNSFNLDEVSSEYFTNAELKMGPYKVSFKQFKNEVNSTVFEFVKEMDSINKSLLETKALHKIMTYYNQLVNKDMCNIT